MQPDLVVAFVHTGLYVLLAIVDIYALRHPTQKESDRVCLLRYGSTLVAPWPVGCVFAAILFGLQCACVYARAEAAGTNPLLAPPCTRLQSAPPPATSIPVATLEVQEAFRLARQQYGVKNV